MASISGGGRSVLDDAVERYRLKRVSRLVNELRTKKSKDCSMVDYLQRKIAISETLHSLEHYISDEELKFQILKGLPDCYVTMSLELMECSVSVLATKLMGLDMEDEDVDDGVSRSAYVSDGITSSSASRHRRPRRKRRAHKKSVPGDVLVIMTLLLRLLFIAGSKPPSDDFFQPLWKQKHETCSCVGTGLDRKCGCVPYAFIAWQGIIFAGVSIAAVSLVKLMPINPYGWMWIAIVIAYIWNGIVITPYKYRGLLVVMYVVIVVLLAIMMWIKSYWNWGVICMYSRMGFGLIWLYIKAASQFLGVGIIHLWQGTKTTLWQLGQACKIFVSTMKNEACSTIFGAPPDPEQEPLV